MLIVDVVEDGTVEVVVVVFVSVTGNLIIYLDGTEDVSIDDKELKVDDTVFDVEDCEVEDGTDETTEDGNDDEEDWDDDSNVDGSCDGGGME